MLDIKKTYQLIILILILIVSCKTDNSLKSLKHNEKGLQHISNGELQNAIREFKIAAHLETKSNLRKSVYLRNIAIVYHDLNDKRKSLFYHRKSLTFCEIESADYYIQRGNIHTLLGNLDSSIISLNKAISLEINRFEAHNSLGLIYLGEYNYDFEDLQKALYHNKTAARLNDTYNLNFILAKTYLALDDFRNAEKIYTKLVNRHKDDLELKYLLALTLYFQNRNLEAKSLLTNIMNINVEYLRSVDEKYMLEDLEIRLN